MAGKGKGVYSLHHGHLPAGLHGLRRLCRRLPGQRAGHQDGSTESPRLPQQDVFDYAGCRTCREKQGHACDRDRQGQPVQAAACSSSPAPAQAAPRPLMPASITQLFGDRMYISNATGCSSIWGGPGCDLSLLHRQRTGPRIRLGPTPCLRTTQSTAWACTPRQDVIRKSLAAKVADRHGQHLPTKPQGHAARTTSTPWTTAMPTRLRPKALIAELWKPASAARMSKTSWPRRNI